jgi:hypothetical protein
MYRVDEGAGAPFRQPRSKASARREQAASGCLFFLILFFGRAKKSISPVGARTDIKYIRRASDTIKAVPRWGRFMRTKFPQKIWKEE